jgi:hypothetical protein
MIGDEWFLNAVPLSISRGFRNSLHNDIRSLIKSKIIPNVKGLFKQNDITEMRKPVLNDK